ncbi:MAG: sulfurtransferase [Spirochaetia bacterium]|jgi:thiosulfate/3-mercaptopyruvate sulfurtransferase
MFQAIIDPASAGRLLGDQRCLFMDCRFVMREPDQGETEYRQSHIPGALYAHLDRDLSGRMLPGRTGRHPLPDPQALVRTFSRWGIEDDTRVIAYDDSTGAMAAARLWWMLKWAGHDAVAVLDGGFQRWKAAALPCSSDPVERQPRDFHAAFRPGMAVDADQVLSRLGDPAWIVLDARGADRFRGENETIDPVAGHIRGAHSAPYVDSLGPEAAFKSVEEVRTRLDALSGGRDAEHTVLYCGSGVTAAHLALAFAHAGKGVPRLYPGSWSDWITDPRRPIES